MIFEMFSKNNLTSLNLNATGIEFSGKKEQNKVFLLIMFIFLIVGILGNFLALIKLARKRRFNNGSYTLMLRCLIKNNLIGLLGVTTIIIVKRIVSKNLLLEYSHLYCACWVIFRFFGLSSGCIAVIMSIDRYMIWNHTVFHQEHFTRQFISNAITGLTFIAGIITFLPFFGFGLWNYDENTKECLRYREAKTVRDRAYAILFLIFGLLICITIVTCNTFVMKAILCKKRRSASISSYTSSQSSLTQTSTIDIRFSQLMAFLSLTFVICWMPQMLAIIFALKSNPLPQYHWYFKLADNLMGLLFTLDPFIYVLSGRNIMKFWCCWSKRSSSFRSEVSINNNTLNDSL